MEAVLQEKKLNNMIRQTIIETIQEVLRDPDYHLELQERVKDRLREFPEDIIPFEEVKRKYQ